MRRTGVTIASLAALLWATQAAGKPPPPPQCPPDCDPPVEDAAAIMIPPEAGPVLEGGAVVDAATSAEAGETGALVSAPGCSCDAAGRPLDTTAGFAALALAAMVVLRRRATS